MFTVDSDSVNKIIGGQSKELNMPKNINSEYINDFIIETKEHIENIEVSVYKLESDKENNDLLQSVFRNFHTIKGLAGFVSQDNVQKIAHQTETLLDRSIKGKQPISDSTIKIILDSADIIKKLCDDLSLNNNSDFFSKILNHLNLLQLSGNMPSENEKTELMNRKDKNEQENEKKHKSIDSEYIRINVQKIDNLVDMVGELLINQSQVEQKASQLNGNNEAFISNISRVTRITKELQKLSMSLRMVSLKNLFRKIYQIGRGTIAELGKNANITIVGEETEIDRGVAEKLLDPLIHLMKNSIYHGIEDINQRIEKGKSPEGNVKIAAYNKRGYIYIEFSDDGKGINTDNILETAIEKGLADPSVCYTEADKINFIFCPGFSTLKTANNISGRGVGLDVVKTEVSKLGGRIEVQNNLGLGCNFIMKLPINFAMMNGIIVDILGEVFIIPALHIKRIFKPRAGDWVNIKGKKSMVKVSDSIIPLIRIEKILGIHNFDKSNCVILVLELEQEQRALPVSSIISKRDIVVKSLGYEFKDLSYAYGASILENGKVSIIMDVETLFKGETE